MGFKPRRYKRAENSRHQRVWAYRYSSACRQRAHYLFHYGNTLFGLVTPSPNYPGAILDVLHTFSSRLSPPTLPEINEGAHTLIDSCPLGGVTVIYIPCRYSSTVFLVPAEIALYNFLLYIISLYSIIARASIRSLNTTRNTCKHYINIGLGLSTQSMWEYMVIKHIHTVTQLCIKYGLCYGQQRHFKS